MTFLLAFIFFAAAVAQQPSPEWAEAAKVFGDAGKVQDGIYKITYPRHDLRVSINKTKLVPEAALSSWIAMRREGENVIANGDLVVTAAEIDAVEKALVESNIEITGIHNHLAGETPQLLYVHFFARGPMEKVSSALRAAVPGAAKAKPVPAKPRFDTAEVQRLMKASGRASGAALNFSFPRPHPISMHGAGLPPAMGMATAINFQDSPKGVAATGDFVLRQEEVSPVVNALVRSGARVTAIHNHLVDDEPTMYFVHFWVEGSATQVPAQLRAVLDLVEAAKRN